MAVVEVVVVEGVVVAVAKDGRWTDDEEEDDCLEEWTRRAWAMAMVERGVVSECAAPLIWLSESAK